MIENYFYGKRQIERTDMHYISPIIAIKAYLGGRVSSSMTGLVAERRMGRHAVCASGWPPLLCELVLALVLCEEAAVQGVAQPLGQHAHGGDERQHEHRARHAEERP